MGEREFDQRRVVEAVQGALTELASAGSGELKVNTPGGRFQVHWDENGSATALGQLAFFAEFLEVSGLFESWVESCPLSYTSPNAPQARDVLGTWLLSILDGQRRYAHVTGLRGDAVAPKILGMSKIMSDESLRRALAHLAPTLQRCRPEELADRQAQLDRSRVWMDAALAQSTREALHTKWILDCDTTVKLLYGHQDGAEVSYNPLKPGRPSHVIHTYWIANVRLVFEAEVKNGKAHAARHSLPRLLDILKELPDGQRPELVRADNAFGIEPVMKPLEQIGQPYLFKLRQSAGVRRLIERLWQNADWQDVGGGYHAVEDTLMLSGWERARRVVVVRHAVRDTLLAQEKRSRKGKIQQTLQFMDTAKPMKIWEYAVLVTNAAHELQAIGQLYRDRADCENGFDELKRQWGWGGYTTHDLERCNLSARAVALVYNWWSWYVRLAHPKTRLEAITSRPLLLNGVARLTEHAGQSRLLLTLTHAAGHQIKAMIANVRKGLDMVMANAPQLAKAERWKSLMRYIIDKIIAAKKGGTRATAPVLPNPAPIPTG